MSIYKIPAEGLSKATRGVIGFATGFIAACLATYFIYKRTGDGFEVRLLISSFALGSANMIRSILGDPAENRKDTTAFLRLGIITGLITLAILTIQLYAVAVGAACGLAAVIYRRIKDRP